MTPFYQSLFDEALEAMDDMSREDLIKWYEHVERNPYRVGDISERIKEALALRIKGKK